MFLHGLDDLPDEERQAWETLLQQSNSLVQGAMLAADQVDDPDRCCGGVYAQLFATLVGLCTAGAGPTRG